MASVYEYLETDAFTHPDALTSLGNTTGNVTQPTDGRENTNAEYIEFNIPLVADAPFMKDVSLDLANRWSQFKWGGTRVTGHGRRAHCVPTPRGRAALRWQATDSLLLRASWSQGFRIPSISEFFVGNSNSFPGRDRSLRGHRSERRRHCGVAANGISRRSRTGQIQTTIGGNANLTPERSISRTIGFVYNPTGSRASTSASTTTRSTC